MFTGGNFNLRKKYKTHISTNSGIRERAQSRQRLLPGGKENVLQNRKFQPTEKKVRHKFQKILVQRKGRRAKMIWICFETASVLWCSIWYDDHIKISRSVLNFSFQAWSGRKYFNIYDNNRYIRFSLYRKKPKPLKMWKQLLDNTSITLIACFDHFASVNASLKILQVKGSRVSCFETQAPDKSHPDTIWSILNIFRTP